MEKKVILVNSPYLDIYGVMNIGDNFSFPLGIGYIASILRQNGYLVKIFEPEIEKLNEEQIKEYFIQEKPDVVGISCATPNFKGAVKIAQIVKDNTFATTILGGIHASSAPEQILKNYNLFNFIVYGEGEYTMLELCNALKNKNQPYSDIKGLYYKEDGNIINTPPRPYIEELDTLPFPARELVDVKNYRPNVHLDLGVPGAHIITSRGCPARCTFCASFKTLGYNFRMHSATYVVSEIEEIVNKYDINYIIFVDDTFTINKNRAKTICQMILDKKIKIKWYCFSRVDTINEELAKLMKQAGCFSMLFGIESGNADILRRVKKGISKEKAVQTIHMTNKMGYKTLASFILGLPGETRETIKETVDFAIKLSPTIASFNRLIPYPGTEIYEEFYKDKLKDIKSWDNFVPQGDVPVIEIEGISKEELNRLTINAYLRFYLRISQILRMLASIKSFNELLVYLRGGFGIFRQMLNWTKKI